MQERFSPQQIAKLRDEYGKISTIDPSGQAYKQLVAMLDRLELDDLKTLAGAKIKFVSGLAQNRVNRAKSKNEEVDVKEDTDLEESKSGTGYELYHKDFSSAMAHAYDFAKKKYNIEIDPTEIDRNVAMGPKKPSSGKANAYRLLDKTGKKAIQVQVTNLDNKRYELNMYKEDIDDMSESNNQSGSKTGIYQSDVYGAKAYHSKCLEKGCDWESRRFDRIKQAQDAAKKHAQTHIKPGVSESVDEACWDTHKQEGMKKKGDKMVPNCVPKNEAASPAQQAAIAIAMKKAGKKPKDMEEAVGGGTSVSTQTLKSAEAQKKRAEVAVKIAALKLKQQKERESLQKAKKSVKEETKEEKFPEYKTGGEPLAKKFEKAFAKMGIKTNIKMKTVGNVSVNEAAVKKVLSANKKKKMKEQEETPSKKDTMKSGDVLSGKREPVEINPEIENRK